jgi:hypothetical protein
MDDKLKMQRALLDHLEKESKEIQSLMDELLKATALPGKLIQTVSRDGWRSSGGRYSHGSEVRTPIMSPGVWNSNP